MRSRRAEPARPTIATSGYSAAMLPDDACIATTARRHMGIELTALQPRLVDAEDG